MNFYFVIVGFLILAVLLVAVSKVIKPTVEKQEVLPYLLKNRFFTQSEFVFYGTLLQELDTVRFRIFPKVRIADFVETTATGKDFYTWFNKIKSKHIDFIIYRIYFRMIFC